MEFDRSMFRVYERTVGTLQPNQAGEGRVCSARKITFCIEYTALLLGVISVCSLVSLHEHFTGNAGCMPAQLALLQRPNITLNEEGFSLDNVTQYINGVGVDEILYIDAFPVDASSFNPTYVYSMDPAIQQLSEEMQKKHAFNRVNLTLPRSCLGTEGQQDFIEAFVGYDTIVINYLLYTFKMGGYVRNLETREDWNWSPSQVMFSILAKRGTLYGAVTKAFILAQSLIAFFLITSVTSLMVRALVSSGVVIMYPILLAFRRLRLANVPLRLITFSYPWLGVHLERLRAQGVSAKSFVWAHLGRVAVYYFMLEASQITWSLWLYNKSLPAGMQMWVFGIMLFAEYFSMLFVRSRSSITVYPRLCLAYFLLFHFYFYSFLYSFFLLAAFCMVCMQVHAMMYCLRHFEQPALESGALSLDAPRAVFTQLAVPAWGALLPSTWTLMYPLNTLATTVYEQDVPPLPAVAGGGGGGEEDAAAAAGAGDAAAAGPADAGMLGPQAAAGGAGAADSGAVLGGAAFVMSSTTGGGGGGGGVGPPAGGQQQQGTAAEVSIAIASEDDDQSASSLLQNQHHHLPANL